MTEETKTKENAHHHSGESSGKWSLPSGREQALFWSLTLGGLGLDLWTKALAFKHIDNHAPVQLIPSFLQLRLALNDGAAFSMASGNRVFLVGISSVALLVLLAMFLLGGKRSVLMTIALGLFTGGVAGNFYDRAFNNGLVRDFIDMYIGDHHWPTYNIADALLCIAVGLLFIQTFVASRQEAHA